MNAFDRGARMFAFLPFLTRPSAMPVERVADAGMF